MKLADVLAMWAVDGVIPPVDQMESYSRNIPYLHSKYLSLLIHAKTAVVKIVKDYEQLKHAKEQFYLYGPAKEDTHGWTLPPQGKISRPELPKWIAVDKDLVELGQKLAIANLKVEALEEILDTVNKLSFNVANALRTAEFLNGGR